MENVSQEAALEEIRLLVVDDQADVCRGLRRLLSTLGCTVETADSGEAALSRLQADAYDLIITDIKMAGMSGMELLHEIKRRWPAVEVVIITGYGTIEMAVSSLQDGASHFLTKPFDNEEILSLVRRLGYRVLARRRSRFNATRDRAPRLIAESPAMQRVLRLVAQVAPRNIPVLIQGESGTGKEVVARTIHHRSRVREQPFLAINCAALPDSLLESELFGYTQGAFTGAHHDSPGLFRQAQGGTIFLDEIPSMSLPFQGKLLRVLENKVVRPLGGRQDVPVDFRLVAAANRDLEALVRERAFREDLLYRLQVMQVTLPPLRERREGIPALAEYFLETAAAEVLGPGEPVPRLSPAALGVLTRQDWPGNVRELENAIKRALVVCRGDTITPGHLGLGGPPEAPAAGRMPPYEAEKQQAIESFQETYIRNALRRTGGNVTRAADLCGLTRAAFQRIMKKLAIDREDLAAAVE